MFFFGATEKKWTQTDHKHELFDQKKIRANDVSLPKPHPQVSSPPLSDLEQRIKLISSKLDEGNVKGGIRLAALDDKTAPFSTDNYQKLLSKHPQRAKFAAPNPEKLDSFFVTDFDLYKAIISFPNGSAAGPDKIVLKFLKILLVSRTTKTFFWRKAYRPHKDRRRVETDCHRQHAETYRF